MMEFSATTGIVEIRQSRNEPADNDFCGEITCNIDKKDSYILQKQNLLNGQNNPENSKRIDISYWTWNYKQLMIGIIGGCLLTILIVVPAVYFSTKSNMEKDNLDTNHYIPLKFDKSTLYHSAFMSEDGFKLSRTYSRDTPVSSAKSPNTLSEYRGIIGNRCFERNRKIYFEVEYEFSVIGNYAPHNLIFEVGLAERERVDYNQYITSGWSFHLIICRKTNNTICLMGHNGKDAIDELPIYEISLGSKYSGTFGFIVNRNQETFTVVRNSNTGTHILYSFQSVYSTQRLCPVFATFNPTKYEAKLTLLNTYDFSEAIWKFVILRF